MEEEDVDAELEEAYAGLQAALVRAGVADRVFVVTATMVFLELARNRSRESRRRGTALKQATVDRVTGLIRDDGWDHLEHYVREILSRPASSMLLDGKTPIATVRRVGGDPSMSVAAGLADAMALGHVNAELGLAGGDQLLKLCARAVTSVISGTPGGVLRTSVLEEFDRCAVYRRGDRSDEFVYVLVGVPATRAKKLRDRMLDTVGRKRITGLDIPPGMGIGTIAMHVAIWYVGCFYRWLKRPLPEGEDLVKVVLQMWYAFLDERAAVSKFLGYGLLFAENWGSQDLIDVWMNTKLCSSAFNGRRPEEIRDLCSAAHAAWREGGRKAAEQVLMTEFKRHAALRRARKIADAEASPVDEIGLAIQIFVIMHQHRLPLAAADEDEEDTLP